jgi:hypothetical protein
MELPAALYEPAADGYRATALTIGPWDPGLQHAGPPAALLAREMERVSAVEGGQTVRLAFDILGPVPVGLVRVRGTVLRPGRRIELVEAVLSGADDRPLMRATGWRMRTRSDPALFELAGHGRPGDEDLPLPPPPQATRTDEPAFFRQDVAYHRALEWRFASGTWNRPGPATAWTRPSCALVDGEQMTPLQHLLVMTDAASGISAVLDWTRATFANVDLTVALRRPPRGCWLGMAASTLLGDTGAAQCFAALFDEDGHIGRSSQSLFVEPR